MTRWLGKIQARDFFHDNEQAEAAQAELAECRAVLETFASQVYAQDGIGTANGNDLLDADESSVLDDNEE